MVNGRSVWFITEWSGRDDVGGVPVYMFIQVFQQMLAVLRYLKKKELSPPLLQCHIHSCWFFFSKDIFRALVARSSVRSIVNHTRTHALTHARTHTHIVALSNTKLVCPVPMEAILTVTCDTSFL